MIVGVGEIDATPVASTFRHVAGDDADCLFVGAPDRWNDGAVFDREGRLLVDEDEAAR